MQDLFVDCNFSNPEDRLSSRPRPQKNGLKISLKTKTGLKDYITELDTQSVIIRYSNVNIDRKAILATILANNTGKINPQDTRSLKSRDKMRRKKLPGLKLIPHTEKNTPYKQILERFFTDS